MWFTRALAEMFGFFLRAFDCNIMFTVGYIQA